MSNSLSRQRRCPMGSDGTVRSLQDLVSTSHMFCRNPHLAGQALTHLLMCSSECREDMERLLQRQLKACVSCEENFLWAASAQVQQCLEKNDLDEAKRTRSVLMLVHLRAMADAAHHVPGVPSVFRRSERRQHGSVPSCGGNVSFSMFQKQADAEGTTLVLKTVMSALERGEGCEFKYAQSPPTTLPSPPHVSIPDSFGSPHDYQKYHRECFTTELAASVELELQRGFPVFTDSSPRILPILGRVTVAVNDSGSQAVCVAPCLVETPLLVGDVIAASLISEWDPYAEGEMAKRSGRQVCYGVLKPYTGDLSIMEILRKSPKAPARPDFEEEYRVKPTQFTIMEVVFSESAGKTLEVHMGLPCNLTFPNVALEAVCDKLFTLVPHLRRSVAVSRFPLYARSMRKELIDILLNPCWWARGIHAEVECIVLADTERKLRRSAFDYDVSQQLHSDTDKKNSNPAAIESAAEDVISSRRLNQSQADVLLHVSNIFSRSVLQAASPVNGREANRLPPAGHVDVLTCVQGPPGTGKTRVLCSLLELLYRGCLQAGERVLVCATSNVALDCILIQFRNILESGGGCGLVDAWNVNQEGEDVDVEDTNMPKAVRIGRAALEEAKEFEVEKLCRKTGTRNPRRFPLEATFVFATLSGCAHWSLEEVDFRVLVCDEAAQQAELDLLIPLCRPICMSNPFEMIILFGDQKQLPPTVISSDRAVRQAIGRSFFERIATCLYHCNICEKTVETGVLTYPPAHLGVPFGKVFLLNIQYRCHPKISELTMRRMYEGRVIDGVSEEDRKAHFHDGGDLFRPLVFIDMDTFKGGSGLREGVQAEETFEDRSLFNRAEAHFVARLLITLFETDTRRDQCDGSQELSEHDVVVCTFYKAQVNEVRDALSNELERSSSECVKKAQAVTVTTVDAVQGQESEVVVLSTVRSNPHSGIGFLADQRRVNVAMTRAKKSLYILGSQSTLRGNRTCAAADDAEESGSGRTLWSDLLDHCASKGVIVSTEIVPR